MTSYDLILMPFCPIIPSFASFSAGIGRTGVLITMETAMCLIESNEPVYPLDIVRTMRDQRAMLIQTTAQYRFVCDAIVRVYMGKHGCIIYMFSKQATEQPLVCSVFHCLRQAHHVYMPTHLLYEPVWAHSLEMLQLRRFL